MTSTSPITPAPDAVSLAKPPERNGHPPEMEALPDLAPTIVDEPKRPALPAPQGPTVEILLWFALLLVAALLRFGDLGRWPLSADEARLALAAWQGSEGLPHVSRGLSPLLLGVNSLLFWVFEENDLVARLLPALMGTLTLAALWLWRPLLGRGAALGAALLIALSPTLLLFSRHATPEALSGALSLFLLAGLMRFAWWRRPSDAWLIAVSLALGLTSGPGFWALLAAGALWLPWMAFRARRNPDSQAQADWQTVRAAADELRPMLPRLIGGGLIIFLLAATGFGANPAGLGATFDLPVQWLQNLFTAPPMLLPFTLIVLFYELPIIILGITGAALWIDREPGWVGFLLFWTALTIVPLTLFNSGWAGGVALVALPMALLGGIALHRIERALLTEGRMGTEGAYLGMAFVIGAFLWFNLMQYIYNAKDLHLWLALMSGALMLAGLSLPWVTNGRGAALRSLGLVAALLLITISFRTAWALSFEHATDPREPLAAALTPSDPDIRNLPEYITGVSVARFNERNLLPVAVQRSLGPVPQWYLRRFPNLRIVEGSSPELPIAAILSSDQPTPNEKAIGQRYALRPTWAMPTLRSQALVRWLITRQSRDGLGTQDAILYITVP